MPLPSSAQPAIADDPTRGIALMIAAVATFTVIDTCAKLLVVQLPPWVVVFGRYGLSLVYILALMWWTGTLRASSRHPGLQVLRGLLLMSTTALNFVALQYLRLDQTSAIFFSNPLWVCALSPFLLGEQVGWRRWVAVAVGFIGVLIIIRPGGAAFHWAMWLSLAVAVLAALYQIATRRIGGRDPALVSALAASLIGTAAAAPAGLLQWVTPGWFELSLMLAMGLAGGLGHHLLIKAHTIAPAATLAPFIYTQMIWMIAAGWLVFGDLPDRWTLAGAGLVIASGLYVYYREQIVSRRSMTEVDTLS